MLPDFPFEYDEYDMPMNTRALPDDRLIEVSPHYREELAQKSSILARDHRYYCQAQPGTEAMQWEAIAYVLPIMARHYPEHFRLAVEGDRWCWTNHLLDTETTFVLDDTGSLPRHDHLHSPLPDATSRPLDWLARQVQEDLILMSGDAEAGTPLVAGHLCFGGSWCLDDKMGKSFLAIHHDVPQFIPRIGRPANLVMQRLKEGRPIARLNWSISTTDRLNTAPKVAHEWLHTRRQITSQNAGERCFLRMEWQTLSRLSQTNGILFTIHTTISPLSRVIGDPARLRRLTSVVKGIPRPSREYKGMAGYADALVDYLEARCREAAGDPPTTAGRLLLAERPSAAPILARQAPGGWEPWPIEPIHVLDGEPRARVQWVRRSEPGEPFYQAGLLELEPSRVRWLYSGNESCQVQAGRATIAMEDGTTVEVGPGDMLAFPANTVAIWTITEPLRRFFVASM